MAKPRRKGIKYTPDDERLKYVTALVGTGGRLRDLEGTIYETFEGVKTEKGVFLKDLALGKTTFASHLIFWTEKTKDVVKFEVYDIPPVSNATRGFRKGLGELAIMLLQTGYTVTTENKDKAIVLDF